MLSVVVLVVTLMPAFARTAIAAGTVTFEGGGYGHGVGMPQYGAQGQALDGYSAEQIVEYYYTGASMVSLANAVGGQGSPILDNNNSLWVGIAPDKTVIEFTAVGGSLEVCQPSVACPLEVQPQAGETWKLKLKPNGKCVFKLNGVNQADPGECWASVKRLGGARIDFPSLGMTVGHGTMRIRPKNTVADPGKFHVSFNMDLEDYLLGIAEALNWWEPAALQAQAIASRSYAVAKAHQRETLPRSGVNPGFTDTWKSTCWCHVRATTADQAYKGWAQAQSASWSAAVAATDSKVLTHPDSAFTERGVVSAFYSSSSSGVTETNVGGFGSTVQYPYLVSVDDPWSGSAGAANPFASWQKEVPEGQVVDVLRATTRPWKADFDSLTSVQHLTGPPESVVRFTGSVGGSEKSVDVPGWWLRTALGLRSPQITDVSYGSGYSQLWHQDVGAVPSSMEDADRFGSALAAGDFDDDGHLDLAVAAHTDGINAVPKGGLVNILYGAPGGLTDVGSLMIHEDITGVPGVAEAHDHLGMALAIGDFDGDGYDDLAIGIPHQDDGAKADVGSVLVVFGSAAGLDMSDSHRVGPADAAAYGGAQRDLEYGWSLAAGDFDGDGKSDLAVGAPGRRVDGQDSAGKVQVLTKWNGSAFAVVKGITENTPGVPGGAKAGDEFGYELAAADFDADGVDDLAVGAPGKKQSGQTDAGVVVVLKGSGTGIDTAASFKLSQRTAGVPGVPNAGAQFGKALAGGDLDNDGRDDLAVGSPGDVVGGVPGGSVTVIPGTASGFDTTASRRIRQGAGGMPGSPESGDRFGAALAIGDVHADGRNDLLVGVPGESIGGVSDAGMVRLVKGVANGLAPGQGGSQNQSKPGFNGTLEANDEFGSAVGIWDFDGDGRGEWAVGVPNEDSGGFTNAGVLHIVYGF